MKSYRTILHYKRSPVDISPDCGLFFMGSCFSNHIYNRLNDRRFHTISNPFGIIYNPLSIAKAFASIINKKEITEDELIPTGELWTSWDCHRSMAKLTKAEFVDHYNTCLLSSLGHFQKTNVVFITLGSAFAYFTKESDTVVANCQKYPAKNFSKRLISIQEIISAMNSMIEGLRAHRPDLKVVFTVSPVRHIKDGIVENNRSKAHLLSAVHDIVDQLDDVHYFPSYELLMDDLRDYRFYKTDMLHPSDEAVDYIWQHFAETYFTSETQDMVNQIERLNAAQAHRPLFPETESHQKFTQCTIEMEEKLRHQYPGLAWE